MHSEHAAPASEAKSEHSIAPTLGAYANVIRSYGAASDGHKVIRLSEDALKRLPVGAELSGTEPRGTIVLPDNKGKDRKLLDHYFDFLNGTPVPEPYNFRARMGANVGYIYGEGSWWVLRVYGRDVGCTAQANQLIGYYFYWWAAGSTGQWWLLDTVSYSSSCPLSEFDPVAVGAGTPPSAAPSTAPTTNPSSTPAPYITLEADSLFSPNGDGKKDTATVTIGSNASWTLSIDGVPGSVDHSGNLAYTWDGKLNNAALPDGKYTLRLKSGTLEKTADVVIDNAKPVVDITSIKAQSWTADGRSIVMAGTASVTDRELAGLDPSSTKVTIIGKDVTSSSSTISADGSDITFTYTVTPPLRGFRGYKLNALGEANSTDAGSVAVDISAYDRASNGVGSQHNYDFYYPDNGTGLANGFVQAPPKAPANRPLPEVKTQPESEPPLSEIDWAKYVQKLFAAAQKGWIGMVIFIASELPYDPADAPPPPLPPGPPRPKPGPEPSPSPSPTPCIPGQVEYLSPYDFVPIHGRTYGKNKFRKWVEQVLNIGVDNLDPIHYVEYQGGRYIVDGHHRLLAAKELHWPQIRAQRFCLPYNASIQTPKDLAHWLPDFE